MREIRPYGGPLRLPVYLDYWFYASTLNRYSVVMRVLAWCVGSRLWGGLHYYR